MTAVNISATFKKDEREYNGLEAIAEALIKDPLRRHVIVGVVETTQITKDILGGGTETPTIRFVNIEALDGDAAVTAREMLDARYRERTGRQENPQPSLFEDGAAPGMAEYPATAKTDQPWPGDSDYPQQAGPESATDPNGTHPVPLDTSAPPSRLRPRRGKR